MKLEGVGGVGGHVATREGFSEDVKGMREGALRGSCTVVPGRRKSKCEGCLESGEGKRRRSQGTRAPEDLGFCSEGAREPSEIQSMANG